MKESNRQKDILERLSKLGLKLFRINVGRAWTGNDIIHFPRNHKTYPGAILIKDPRPFKTGVPAGYSDVTGFTQVEITQEMVGKTIAVFTAIEVKTDKGIVSPKQKNFLFFIDKCGGISIVARTADDAERLILNAVDAVKNPLRKN